MCPLLAASQELKGDDGDDHPDHDAEKDQELDGTRDRTGKKHSNSPLFGAAHSGARPTMYPLGTGANRRRPRRSCPRRDATDLRPGDGRISGQAIRRSSFAPDLGGGQELLEVRLAHGHLLALSGRPPTLIEEDGQLPLVIVTGSAAASPGDVVDDDFSNSTFASPIDRASFGSLLPPKISTHTNRMMRSSGAPTLDMAYLRRFGLDSKATA